MTALNMTALSEVQGFSQVVCVANNSTDGILTGGFLIAFFFIMLLVLKKWDFIKALVVSSWTSFILSLLMVSVTCPDGSTWLSVYYALVFLLVSALSAMYMWSTGE